MSAGRAAIPDPDDSTSPKLPGPQHGLRLNSQHTCLQQTTFPESWPFETKRHTFIVIIAADEARNF